MFLFYGFLLFYHVFVFMAKIIDVDFIGERMKNELEVFVSDFSCPGGGIGRHAGLKILF